MKAVVILTACALALSACDSDSVKTAKEAAAAELKDPSSAQFRNVREGRDGYVCGEMNGKNGFGAYNGFRRFAAIGSTAIVDDGTTTSVVDDMWRHCAP